jgi:hypothetical protein
MLDNGQVLPMAIISLPLPSPQPHTLLPHHWLPHCEVLCTASLHPEAKSSTVIASLSIRQVNSMVLNILGTHGNSCISIFYFILVAVFPKCLANPQLCLLLLEVSMVLGATTEVQVYP